jgi:predicted AAA+ superfamily ATPase
MTLTDQVIKNIVSRLIKSQDYRIEVINLINADFLQFAVAFFKKVVHAKIESKDITIDWYKNAFMDKGLSTDDIAINAGLNKKTISNMYGTARKNVVIDAAYEHFESLYESIQSLIDLEKEIELTLTIKFNNVSVDLNVSESLIVVNTLAVKRAAIRGGFWSTAGKSVEKYLMITLCKLYNLSEDYYDSSHFIKNKKKNVDREVDFYLLNGDRKFRCEVKLMGQGNPESADAIFARQTQLFVADKLSQQNINQCEQLGIEWVELRRENGFRRFKHVLDKFGIPHTDFSSNLDVDLPVIMNSLFYETKK